MELDNTRTNKMKSQLLHVCYGITLLFAIQSVSAQSGTDYANNKKAIVEKETEPLYEIKVKGDGYVYDDISQENNQLNKSLWVEHTIATESKRCNYEKKTADWVVFDYATQKANECYDLVEDHGDLIQDQLEEEYEKEKEGVNGQIAAQRFAAKSEALRMKMEGLNKRCSRAWSQVQYLGLRTNYVYSIWHVRRKQNCEKAWTKSISKSSGNCAKSQQAALKSYKELYARSSEVPASKQTAFVNEIKRLVNFERSCNSIKLAEKKLHCDSFIKGFENGVVSCDLNGANAEKTTSLQTSHSFLISFLDFVFDNAHAGKVWDEFESMKGGISEGLTTTQDVLPAYIFDPIVRGASMYSTVKDKKDSLSTYDKIAKERLGRLETNNEIIEELGEGVTESTSSLNSSIDKALYIDPDNPLAINDKNLEGFDEIAKKSQKCTYGMITSGEMKGTCKGPNILKMNEFYGTGEGQHIKSYYTNPVGLLRDANAVARYMASGRMYGKEASKAFNQLSSHGLLSDGKDKKFSFEKISKLAGVKLPKTSLAKIAEGEFEAIAYAMEKKKGTNSNTAVASSSSRRSFSPDQEKPISEEKSEKAKALEISESKEIRESGHVSSSNSPGEWKFNWEDQENVSDEYYKKMEQDVAKLVKEGEVPKDTGIHSQRNRDIFKIITRRYMVTGYTRLGLEERKPRRGQ